MIQGIFKNEEIYNNCLIILNNQLFTLKSYWFKRVAFENIINSTGKIQYKTSVKLLKVYNDYYKTNFSIKDIFKSRKLLNQTKSIKVNFNFIDDWWSALDKVIEEVLSLIERFLFNKNNNKKEINYNWSLYEYKDINNDKLMFFTINIISIIIIYVYYIVM